MPTPTPSFSRHSRTMSPPLSSAPSLTAQYQQQKLNVVTRLAIEGKAKQGEPGVAVKMYLKISLPLDSVAPGSTIPLFAEENIKILTSQVHPIDSNSIPYNFSSTISPMLHHAARALMLPARSPQSYLSLFGLSPAFLSSTPSSQRYSSSPSSSSNTTPKLDDKYTGHILVSGYNVSFVVPKEFPPRSTLASTLLDHDATPHRRRRPSISDKNILQFMAAIEMMVPFLSRPPRAPYLISLPTPRCLSNSIKLRIFPPATTASSYASLSSAEEEAGSWDLTSDPHVTRTPFRPSRSNSYTHFADDESSDSSNTGFADGCGIEGTFPSTERVRVRWAAPMKSIELPAGGNGRRKVGVREVKGDMTCIVLGKGKDTGVGGRKKEGVIMKLEYKGTCKGVWFPGVATLLGLDVGLLAKNSDVTWVQGMESKWTVGGGSGFTGWDVAGILPTQMDPKDASMETPVPPAMELRPTAATRYDSNTSTSSSNASASLLRVPLPLNNIPDYSFENSAAASAASSAPSGTVSSSGSLPQNSPNGTRSRAGPMSASGGKDQIAEPSSRPPVLPVTVHVNMNELLPPSKNVFTFHVSGVVLVTPKARMLNGSGTSVTSSPTNSEDETDTEPVVLPYFNILAADSEKTSIVLRNDAEGSTVDVYNPSGDIREAQTRKTVLRKGGFTTCGIDGERIAVRPFRSSVFSREPFENVRGLAGARPKTPNGGMSRVSSNSSMRQAYRSTAPVRPRRDGPLMIPWVVATVTPLLTEHKAIPDAYAVRLCLPAPSDRNSEWLEFGFPLLTAADSAVEPPGNSETKLSQVDIASVSLEGVPVRYEAGVISKQGKGEELAGLKVGSEETDGKEWMTWVKVHVGDIGGGRVEVNYIPKAHSEGSAKKGKRKGQTELDVSLPAFLLPIGRLEVQVESAGLDLASLRTNLKHQQSTLNGPRLIHHSAEELFYPQLSLSMQSKTRHRVDGRLRRSLPQLLAFATPLVCVFLLYNFLQLGSEIRQIKSSLEAYPTLATAWSEGPETPTTVTVTSTVVSTSSHNPWWFGAGSTDDASSIKHGSPSEPSLSDSGSPSQALLAIDSLPFPWPLRFDIPTQLTFDDVLDGLRKLWQFCRTVYHYPLPPP